MSPAQVRVPYLPFLEKQLTDLHTFVRKLPVLDAAESWNLDPSTDCWKTDPVRTIRTKKVPCNHVKAEAAEKHPAQVEVYFEDNPSPGTTRRGGPSRQRRPRETQILAPVSVFAAERRIDRMRTITDGWGFKSPLCLFHGTVVQRWNTSISE